MKQDMNGVRTAQDLERKYNLSEVKKNIELAADKIFKVNNELTNFANSVTSQFEEVQTAIDTKAEIWFYSGAPSLSNLPTSSWEDFFMHIGDLYYDTETGYAYRFKVLEDVYSWEQVQDQDTVESLALANSASDTADSKRRVFLGTPTTPYDTGDLWIHNEELYVCQTAKETGEYTEGDFTIATKYTDDTVANEVASALSEVRESVTFLNGTEGGIFRPIDSNGDGINDGFILADRTDAVLPSDAKCLVANYEGIGFSQDAGETYSIALKHDGVAGNWSFSGSQAIEGTNIKGYVANIVNPLESFSWNNQGFLFYDQDNLPPNDPPQFDDVSDAIGAIRFQQVRADEGRYRSNQVNIIAKKSTNQDGFGTSLINLNADKIYLKGEIYVNDEPLETIEYIPAQYGNARVVKRGNGDCEMDIVVSRGNYFTTVENGLLMTPVVDVSVPTGYFISVFSCHLDAWLPNNAWVMRQGFSTTSVNFRCVCGGGLDSTGGTVCIRLVGRWK